MHRRRLARTAIDNGGILFGEFVYKTLLRGESSNLEIKSKNVEHTKQLVEVFKTKHDCELRDPPTRYRGIPGIDYLFGFEVVLSCPNTNNLIEPIKIILDDYKKHPSPIHNLRYGKIDSRTNGDSCGGAVFSPYLDDSEVFETISDVRNKRYTPWENMNEVDKKYFEGWRIKGSISDKFRRMCGFY